MEMFTGGDHEADVVAPVLITPPRQVATFTIWERDDEPDYVLWRVEIRGGDGHLIVLRQAWSARDQAWQSAGNDGLAVLREAWYESHGPF